MDRNAIEKGRAETLRARELYRYFTPSLGLPRNILLDDDDYVASDPSKDASLIAFVQLTAIQLRVKQALLSLIDSKTQYLVAQSVPITGPIPCSNNQTQVFARDGRLCMETLMLEVEEGVFEISDLTKSEKYKDLEFVRNAPHYSFYAGVPIRTVRGLNIGTLCLLDDRVRVLTADDRQGLLMMGDMVMRHLEVTRRERERATGIRMQSKLGQFVAEGVLRNGKGTKGWMKAPDGSKRNTEEDEDVTEIPLSKSLRNTYLRAAELIVEAMSDVHALLFISPKGTLIEEFVDHDDQLPSILNTPEPWSNTTKEPTWDPRRRNSGSYMLASRLRSRKSIGSRSMADITPFDETFISHFLTSFPSGKIFNYAATSPTMAPYDDATPTSPRTLSRVWSSLEDYVMVNALKNFCPSSKSAVLFPLYDEVGHPASLGLLFTDNPCRIFTTEELGFLNIFGNTIMSEVTLLTTISADNAKKKFISSISHELRSPLHGILAGSELLLDTKLALDQIEYLETIKHCGETLLDTLNHVLDYSTLDHANLKRNQPEFGEKNGRNASEIDLRSILAKLELSEGVHPDKSQSLTDLSELTERVVDVVMAGHGHRTRIVQQAKVANGWQCGGILDNALVATVLEIERKETWTYVVPSAAFRRILMNLLGNALKYTESGFVRIQLSTTQHDGTEMVSLVVSDTGKGISEDFINESLFTPFSQEDDMSPGTGLGMAIVNLLVQGLGGTIKAESKVGQGTTFTVLLPLHLASVCGSKLAAIAGKHSGKRALLVGYAPDNGKNVVTIGHRNAAIEEHASWIGLTTQYVDIPTFMRMKTIDFDFIALNGLSADFKDFEVQDMIIQNLQTPMLISHNDHSIQRAGYIKNKNPGLIFICLPCGPHKLCRTVDSLLSEDTRLAMAQYNLPNGVNNLQLTPKPVPGSFMLSPPTSPSRPLSNGPTAGCKKPSVLVVDDNPINLKLLVQYLKIKKYDYSVAENGLIALEAMKKRPGGFDIILMDLQMPVMNGIDSTSAIRDHESICSPTQRSLIIAVTGLAAQEDQRKAMEVGMDLFWTKPVALKKLAEELKRWEVANASS